jgi:hypothetical protein
MKRRAIVTLLALFVFVFPTLHVAADDLNTSPSRPSATKTATQAAKDDNKSRRSLGRTLLGLGGTVFVFGVVHPVPRQCGDRRCQASTRDAHVFVSGAAVASVGAWLLWWKHKPRP